MTSGQGELISRAIVALCEQGLSLENAAPLLVARILEVMGQVSFDGGFRRVHAVPATGHAVIVFRDAVPVGVFETPHLTIPTGG